MTSQLSRIDVRQHTKIACITLMNMSTQNIYYFIQESDLNNVSNVSNVNNVNNASNLFFNNLYI